MRLVLADHLQLWRPNAFYWLIGAFKVALQSGPSLVVISLLPINSQSLRFGSLSHLKTNRQVPRCHWTQHFSYFYPWHKFDWISDMHWGLDLWMQSFRSYFCCSDYVKLQLVGSYVTHLFCELRKLGEIFGHCSFEGFRV